MFQIFGNLDICTMYIYIYIYLLIRNKSANLDLLVYYKLFHGRKDHQSSDKLEDSMVYIGIYSTVAITLVCMHI